MRSTLFALAVVSFAGTTLAQGQCRFPNGTLLPNDPGYNEYTPCSSGPTSICCGTNRNNTAGGDPSKGFTKDECLPNGLCQNRITTNGVQTTSYWVDFCTEGNDSPNCLNVCDQTRAGFGNSPLTPCTGRADSDRWCCGSSNACCTSNVGVVTLAQVLGASISSSIVSSATSKATSSASASASNSASASAASGSASPSASGGASSGTTTSSKKSGLSGGAIAGIVIGVVAGLALLAAVLFFARRASKYKKQAGAGPNYHEAPAGQPPQYPGYAAPGSEKYGQQVQHNQGYAHNTPPTELPAMHAAELASPEGHHSPKPLLHQQA